MKRYRVVTPLLFGSALTLTAAFGTPAPAEELRLGFIAPLTGIQAQVGKDMVNGFQMYLDEVNGDFAGAQVKFIVEDDQAKPDTGVIKAKKLILQDKVHMLVGIYIKKVEKKKMFGYDKDELWNTVIKTYPNVSQFWTYGKDAFLKQPVYSRGVPPCRYCE